MKNCKLIEEMRYFMPPSNSQSQYTVRIKANQRQVINCTHTHLEQSSLGQLLIDLWLISDVTCTKRIIQCAQSFLITHNIQQHLDLVTNNTPVRPEHELLENSRRLRHGQGHRTAPPCWENKRIDITTSTTIDLMILILYQTPQFFMAKCHST